MPVVPEHRKHIAIKNVIDATIDNIKNVYSISLGVIIIVIGLWQTNTPYFTSQFIYYFFIIYTTIAHIFIFCIIKLHLKTKQYIIDILSNKEVDLPDNYV